MVSKDTTSRDMLRRLLEMLRSESKQAGDHLNNDDFDLFVKDAMTEAEADKVARHVAFCEECGIKLELMLDDIAVDEPDCECVANGAVADKVRSWNRIVHDRKRAVLSELEAEQAVPMCHPWPDSAPGALQAGDLRGMADSLVRKSISLGPMTAALHQIRDCESADSIVKGLLPLAHECGLENIRYYPFAFDAGGEGKLFSYASAGHDPRTERWLWIGQITKFTDTSPLKRSDSFWSLAMRMPTVVMVDTACTEPVTCYVLAGSVPVIVVPDDPSGEFLGHRSWVDFPHIIAGRIEGKFSCDLAEVISFDPKRDPLVDPKLNEKLLTFYDTVQQVAPRIRCLYEREVGDRSPDNGLLPVEEVGEEIMACPGQDALFDCCVDRIGNVLGAQYGSILTGVEDDLGIDLLTLRRTSYGKSKELEGRDFYRAIEDGLTPWVYRTMRSICLHDLGDRAMALEKIRHYDANLRWANKIADSDEHGDVLMVAISGHGGRILGVLRFTQRKNGRNGPHFTEREQFWLERLAREFIGPKFESLLAEETSRYQKESLKTLDRFSACGDVVYSDVLEQLKAVVPQDKNTKKVFFVNILEEDKTRFRHYNSRDETLDNISGLMKERYSLEGTLTGYSIERQGEVVFLHDLDEAEERGVYYRCVPEAVCALACAMVFNGETYGSIVLLSDHFDLCPQAHGPAIKIIADRTAMRFWTEERRAAMAGQSGVANCGSSVAAVVDEIATLIRAHENAIAKEDVARIEILMSLLSTTVRAYQIEGPFKPSSFMKGFQPFNIRDVVERTAMFVRCRFDEERHLENAIPDDLVVCAEQGVFIGIMGDLIRHFWMVSANVRMEAEQSPDKQWLSVRLMSQEKRENAERNIASWGDELHRVMLCGVTPPEVDVVRSRRLADWWRLSDGRRGNVRFLDENGYGLTLKLPVLAPETAQNNRAN